MLSITPLVMIICTRYLNIRNNLQQGNKSSFKRHFVKLSRTSSERLDAMQSVAKVEDSQVLVWSQPLEGTSSVPLAQETPSR